MYYAGYSSEEYVLKGVEKTNKNGFILASNFVIFHPILKCLTANFSTSFNFTYIGSPQPVLRIQIRIRIRSDPVILAGSGSGSMFLDPDPTCTQEQAEGGRSEQPPHTECQRLIISNFDIPPFFLPNKGGRKKNCFIFRYVGTVKVGNIVLLFEVFLC